MSSEAPAVAAARDDLDRLVEPGGLQVIDGAAHDPIHTALVAQGAVLLAEQAKQLGTAALRKRSQLA